MATNPFSIPTAVPGLYQNQGIQSRDNLNELDPEEALAAQNLNRKQQIANLLMQRGLQPIQGQQTGRFYVPPSWAQGLSQLASAGLGAGLTNHFGNQQAEIGQQAAQQRAQAVQDYIRKTSPQEVTTEQEGPGAPQQKDLLGSQPFVSQLSPQELAQGRWQQEVDTQGPGAFQEGPRPTTTTMQAPTEATKRDELIKVMTARDPSIRKFGELQFQAQQAEKEHAAQRAQQIAENAKSLAVRREGIAMNSQIHADQLQGNILMKQMMLDGALQRGGSFEQVAELKKSIADDKNDLERWKAQLKSDTDKDIAASKAAKGAAGMSPTEKKELFTTEEETLAMHQAKKSIGQAAEINDKAMGFTGAGAVASVGSILPESMRPATVDATLELDNLVTSSVLPQLKATFGGQPTEGERKVMIDVAGASSKPASVRKDIFKRAQEALDARIKFNTEKAKALRAGTYFSPEGGLPAQPAGPTAAPAGQPSLDDLLNKYK